MYTQRTAALRATTLDSNIIDTQRLLIYPGEGDRNERINVAEKLNKNSSFIDNVVVSVNNLELTVDKKIEEINSDINNTNNTIVELAAAVDSNKVNADAKFEEIDAVIGGFDGSVGDLGDSINELSNSLSSLGGSLGELETTVAELGGKNYAYTDTENTFSSTNTFNDQVTVNNNVLISDGVLTFEDTIDGTVADTINPSASGYRYIQEIPSSFDNGVCYDIGEISDSTDLSSVRFSAEGRLVQTCELWFTTSATPSTKHKWPTGIYWIDSDTGAAPTLLASKNYRLVFRQEPNKIIASIAYLY